MSAVQSGLGSTEDRLVNWAGWIHKLEPTDKEDAKAVDAIVKKMPEETKQVLRAVYVEFPKQSIYFLAAELALPPTFINRTISEAKNVIQRATVSK